jgi:caffeoyl-CoA O-methyltransferase
MVATDNSIFASVDNYISELFAPEDETLREIETSIIDANFPNQSISPNQGKLLHTLALVCNAKKILELGTFAGYSTAWLARALLDNGQLISLEFDPMHKVLAERNIEKAGLKNKVDIRLGRALDLLPLLQTEGIAPFDMIFIDADKPSYTHYLEWAIKLSRPGTLIVADNVIRNGKILDESQDEKVQGVQRFNAALSKNTNVSATILQMVGIKDYDGMAIAVVK